MEYGGQAVVWKSVECVANSVLVCGVTRTGNVCCGQYDSGDAHGMQGPEPFLGTVHLCGPPRRERAMAQSVAIPLR